MYMYARYLILLGLGLSFIPILLLRDFIPAMIAVILFFVGIILVLAGSIYMTYKTSQGTIVLDERTKKITYKGIAMALFVTIPILIIINGLATQGAVELSIQQFFWIFLLLFAFIALLFQTYYKRKGDID